MSDNDTKPRPARPWDLFDEEIGRVETAVAEARLELCKACDRYLSLTHQCKECGCIMNAKVKLPNAFCPLQKWSTAAAAPSEVD
jgi:rRNA maturation protein Nop10